MKYKETVCENSKKMLPLASDEQLQILINLETGNNVIVNSVAGSGKTTSNLHISKKFPDKNILLLTYNAKLKIETRQRVASLEIGNLETHSYHSFCVKYYHDKCFTDSELKVVLTENILPRRRFKYDIIILDEAQDITSLFFEIICKIYCENDVEVAAQLVVMGDEKQSIFGFHGADERFITFAADVFSFNPFPWSKCFLTKSYRITHEMAQFLNFCMLHENRIRSSKTTNIQPNYIQCNSFEGWEPFFQVKNWLEMGILPGEIFILAPTIKAKTSIWKLENRIKEFYGNKVPIFVPTGDDTKLDDEILNGKLIFSTFHQSKGLERTAVMVLGFDSSYFEFYKKDVNPNICPNELYVATTRALKHLTLIHHYEKGFLPFLDREKISEFSKFQKKPLKPGFVLHKEYSPISPTELLAHVGYQLLDECYECLIITELSPKKEMINIPWKITQDYDEFSGSECVSEITGLAIPSYYALKSTGSIEIFENILKELTEMEKMDPFYTDVQIEIIKIDVHAITPEQLLYISTVWDAIKSKLKFKLYQIKNYNWLTSENLYHCFNRLLDIQISPMALFEQKFEVFSSSNKELLGRNLIGFADCLDNNKLFEFKCVQELKKEHFLQLAIYAYLSENNPQSRNFQLKENLLNDRTTKTPGYFLYNILSAQMFEIKCNSLILKRIVKKLMDNKFCKKPTFSDEAFLFNLENAKKSAINRYVRTTETINGCLF